MIDGFGTVLDRLQNLFGKGYLVAGFFPVLLFALLSLPLIPIVAPESPFLLKDLLNLPLAKQTLVVFLLVAALSFFGFVVWMTNSWFRRFLEGHIFWPEPLMRPFIRWQQHRLMEKEKELSELRPQLVLYRLDVRDNSWQQTLADARQKGKNQTATPGEVSQDLIDIMISLEDLSANSKPIKHAEMQRAFELLKGELSAKNAEILPKLGEVHNEFLAISKYAHEKVEAVFGRKRSDRYLQFPDEVGDIRPTILANLTAAHQDYMFKRYGMNIELFWPGIAKIARNDEKFQATLEEAKIRLDFSVSMTVMSVLFTLIWTSLLLWHRTSMAAFTTVAVFGPLATMIFYQITVLNAYSFNASVRSAVELFRFDLLKALHIDLPTNSAEEKQRWLETTLLAELTSGNVKYKHAGSP